MCASERWHRLTCQTPGGARIGIVLPTPCISMRMRHMDRHGYCALQWMITNVCRRMDGSFLYDSRPVCSFASQANIVCEFTVYCLPQTFDTCLSLSWSNQLQRNVSFPSVSSFSNRFYWILLFIIHMCHFSNYKCSWIIFHILENNYNLTKTIKICRDKMHNFNERDLNVANVTTMTFLYL